MHPKGSRKWFQQVSDEWAHYVGDHATLREYAAGGALYLKRLRRDLTEWWGDHPDPAKRLSPEEIEALAHRLADYIDSWLSPITPPETYVDILPDWLASAPKVSSDNSTSEIARMNPPRQRHRAMKASGGEDTSEGREPHS